MDIETRINHTLNKIILNTSNHYETAFWKEGCKAFAQTTLIHEQFHPFMEAYMYYRWLKSVQKN